MKYKFLLSAFAAVFISMGLSSCYYGPYHHRGPRPHYYRHNHHSHHHHYRR